MDRDTMQTSTISTIADMLLCLFVLQMHTINSIVLQTCQNVENTFLCDFVNVSLCCHWQIQSNVCGALCVHLNVIANMLSFAEEDYKL